MKVKTRILAAALSLLGLIGAQSANATVLDGWSFNASLLNGQSLSGGGTVTGALNATNIDHINVVGTSVVTQTVVGGVALGQTFTDSGVLQLNTYSPEGGGATGNLNFGSDGAGNALVGYVYFSGLTGTLNLDGSITFDPGSGSLAFYLDNDMDLNPLTGSVLKVFELALLAPSGGSNLDFFGGTAADSTIALTADIIDASVIAAGIIKDSSNNDVTLLTLQLVNTNSLLDPNFSPNPDNTGIDPVTGDGVSIIRVQNNGQYNVTTVPEPGSLALLSLGLIGLGYRRIRKS